MRYYAIEKEFWRQKPGFKWFNDGDRNTKFFHTVFKVTRKKLHVNEI